MGIDEEKIDEIIALHTETVEGLKADVARYKEDAEKLPQAREDLKKAQDALEEATKDEWREKYDSLKTEYDTFKEAQAAKETHGAKETAYRKLLGGQRACRGKCTVTAGTLQSQAAKQRAVSPAF